MTIRRFAISCAMVAALATPALASAEGAPSDAKNAAKYCQALRTKMGVDAFRGQYGTNENHGNAFGKCVSRQRKGKHGVVQAVLRGCKAEYQAGPAAFLAKYGEPAATESLEGAGPRPAAPQNSEPPKPDAALRQAMHNCVKAHVADQLTAVKNAAHTCKEELAADADAFREKYGSNHNKRNAFGKCVAQHAKEAKQESEGPDSSEQPESPEPSQSPTEPEHV
jgi:hypothetical protein